MNCSPASNNRNWGSQTSVAWLMFLLVWCSSAARAGYACSVRAVSPLEGVEALRIEILIGGGLDSDLDTGPALRLFGGDLDRAADFEGSLLTAIRAALEACQVKVRAEAEDVLHVAIYGRSLLLPEQRAYGVSLLEVRVLRDSLADCDCESGEETAIRTILGFALDEELEDSLILQVQKTLSEVGVCRPGGG